MAINADNFPWTIDEWSHALLAEFYDQYRRRPMPPVPVRSIRRQARVQAMRDRYPYFALYHPDDRWRRDSSRAGQMLRQRRNGRPEAAEIAIEGKDAA